MTASERPDPMPRQCQYGPCGRMFGPRATEPPSLFGRRQFCCTAHANAARLHLPGGRCYTDEQVREMRERAAAGERQVDLADRFGASQAYVSLVVRGQVRRAAGGPMERRSQRGRGHEGEPASPSNGGPSVPTSREAA